MGGGLLAVIVGVEALNPQNVLGLSKTGSSYGRG